MVTREEIEEAFRTDDNELCVLKCDALLQRLLTERDEALKWKEAYRSICIDLGGHENPIDAEAKRIVEKKI